MNPIFAPVRKARRVAGFTLVETLMAVTIMGFASAGIVSVMQQGLKM